MVEGFEFQDKEQDWLEQTAGDLSSQEQGLSWASFRKIRIREGKTGARENR